MLLACTRCWSPTASTWPASPVRPWADRSSVLRGPRTWSRHHDGNTKERTPSVEGVLSLIPASAKDRTQPRDRPLAECRHRAPLPAEPPSGRSVRCRLSFTGKRDPVVPFVAVVQMHTATETSWRQVGRSRTALRASTLRMLGGLVALHTLVIDNGGPSS